MPQRLLTDSPFLREIVRRIRATAEPERIILFGSQARGEERADSDLDLFIVMESNLSRHKRAAPFYRALSGLGIAKDIVVYTPAEVASYSELPESFLRTALREGLVLYDKNQGR
jgi:predicted nucleotidyltransferase